MVKSDSDLAATYEGLRRGRMSRREFLARAAALGVSAPLSLVLVNSLGDGRRGSSGPYL